MFLYRVYCSNCNCHEWIDICVCYKWINVCAKNATRAKKLHTDFKGKAVCLGMSEEKKEKILSFGG